MTTDADLERTLRLVLRAQAPSTGAPESLRAGVAAIPDRQPGDEPAWLRLLRPLSVPLAAAGIGAAALAIAAFGLTRAPVSNLPPGGVGGVPRGFDPSITGVGLLTGIVPTAVILGLALVVVSGVIAAGTFFSARSGTNRGRAYVLLGLVGVAAGIRLVQSDLGLEGGNVRAAPLGYVESPADRNSDVTVWSQTAAAGEPTVLVFSLRNASSLPVRIEGLVVPAGDEGSPRHWTALWLPPPGEEAGVPGLDVVRPFEPFTLAPEGLQTIYLAGLAGPCAAGATATPGIEDGDGASGVFGPKFTVAYSIAGIANTAEVDIAEIVVEPWREGCTIP
jgi:hypothetical protein